MTDDTDHVKTTYRMPEHVRDAAQAVTEHGELSEAVRRLHRAVANGESPTAAARFAAEEVRLESEMELARSQIDDAEDRLSALRDRRSALNELRDETDDRRADYDHALAQIEQDVRDGMNVFRAHGAVQQAAQAGGVSPSEVISDLRERNPDLPDRAFCDGRSADVEWRGVSGDR